MTPPERPAPAAPDWLLDRIASASGAIEHRRETVEVPGNADVPRVVSLVLERLAELQQRDTAAVTLVDWSLVATGHALRTLVADGLHDVLEALRRDVRRDGHAVWSESVAIVPSPTNRAEWGEHDSFTGAFVRRVDAADRSLVPDPRSIASACDANAAEIASLLEDVRPAAAEPWTTPLVAHALTAARGDR